MYLKIGNINIYYQKLGKGKPLIMLHGWGNDVSSFWNISQVLKENFTIYLLDLPGFGKSDIPKNFNVEDFAEVIKNFIKLQGLNKPNILGHSLGGRIAIKLTSKYPNLIERLILEDSAGVGPKKTLINLSLQTMAKLFNLIPDFFQFKSKLKIKFYKKISSDYLKTGENKETFKNIISEDLTLVLSKIKNETLLIWGEIDETEEASLAHGKKMYQLIPNSRLEVLEDTGHFPHLEN